MDAHNRKQRGSGRGMISLFLALVGTLQLHFLSPTLSNFQVKDTLSLFSAAITNHPTRASTNDTSMNKVPPPAANEQDGSSSFPTNSTNELIEEIRINHSLQTNPASIHEKQHVVFIGDSLLRYSFLEWLDQKHFMRQEGEYSPPELVNEKISHSWHSYFINSTEHFQGKLYCDCRRSVNFSLSSETENRYYLSDSLWATYLQGYGDNMAHGRIMPSETNNSVISQADGPDKDESPFKWGYVGADWDSMITEYVSKFQRKPTTIVFNAGLWPNNGISNNLGNILKASRYVMGYKGIVVWRAMTKMRDSMEAFMSSSDVSARDWSYRLPWLSYQAFPKLNLSVSDYFDDKHFSASKVYREWNVDLSQGIGSATNPKHRVFILVGAIRTLRLTEKSILQNLIYPICSPPTCIAHLVTHFSFSDNRPSINDDPTGTVISDSQNATRDQFFDHFSDLFPDGFLFVHKVDGYNIGSAEEQAAMDTLESEMDPLVAARMRMFRIGDPRRYSYWIARAWAWRYTQHLSKSMGIEFDFFTFARPDLYWMLPVSTIQFFNDFKTHEKEAWVHDTYFGHVADTFAFFLNYESADIYFSIPPLLKEKVACLGGPNFNKTIVRNRLINEKIQIQKFDFCTEEDHYNGWSEQILQRKLKASEVKVRFYPAGATIVRPPSNPLCAATHVRNFNGYATYHASHAPGAACLALEHQFKENVKEIYEPSRVFRLRSKKRETWSTCLSLNTTSTGSILIPATCQDFPYPPEQMFVELYDPTNSSTLLYGYTADQFAFSLVEVNDKPPDLGKLWSFEHVELYSSKTFEKKR